MVHAPIGLWIAAAVKRRRELEEDGEGLFVPPFVPSLNDFLGLLKNFGLIIGFSTLVGLGTSALLNSYNHNNKFEDLGFVKRYEKVSGLFHYTKIEDYPVDFLNRIDLTYSEKLSYSDWGKNGTVDKIKEKDKKIYRTEKSDENIAKFNKADSALELELKRFGLKK